ncbi:lipopolysaccharide biosynthesis protein [Desulfobacula toluolica]
MMAAGLISFPILTRIFSVTEYGVFGLINTTLFFAIAIAKLGIPNSIVRFYQEYKAVDQKALFYTTNFFGVLIFAATVSLGFGISWDYFFAKFVDNSLSGLIWLFPLLVLVGAATDTLKSFLRAEQRTKSYNIIVTVRRYGAIGLGIFLTLYMYNGLYGFYLGQAAVWLLILLILLIYLRRHIRIKQSFFSYGVLRNAISFGFPIVWAELGHLILNYIDRYLIQIYIGSNMLGLYTAGYNLATHLTDAIIYPINYAMTPIYMKILVNKGEEETRVFFTKLFTYFSLIIVPVVFGFIAVGKDLIRLLASSKYIEAYPVLPYVVTGQAIYACTIILNSGLFIKKKTHLLTYVMGGTCALNVFLNLFLIPKNGIVGAAQATLISYICYTLVLTFLSMREFSFPLEYKRLVMYTFSAGMMFLAINNISTGTVLVDFVSKIFLGATIYFFLVVCLDAELRLKIISIRKMGIFKSENKV